MDNSNLSGSNLNSDYSTMDARQSFAGMQNASLSSRYQYYQQTMGVAALTPPSMLDSPPAQSPSDLMQDYPARFTRCLQPTPPPEIAQVAQHSFLALDGSRDKDSWADSQARQRTLYGSPAAPTPRQQPHLSYPPPTTPKRQSALAATHPAQYKPPATKAQEEYRVLISSLTYSRDAHTARAMMPPPPPRTSQIYRNSVSYASTPTTEASKTDWSTNTDPSLRTHYGLPKWERPIAMTRADCSIAHGTVTSPTPMVGLPFGSTIELANHYR